MCKATDELTKNRREDDEGFDGGFMYEKPGPNCPVVSFELYLSHLNPLNEFLFQRPKRNVPLLRMFGTTTWWSESVHLARKYKAYREKQNFPSFTQTVQSGFEGRHIMAVSGHKNGASIRSYSKTDIYTKKKIDVGDPYYKM